MVVFRGRACSGAGVGGCVNGGLCRGFGDGMLGCIKLGRELHAFCMVLFGGWARCSSRVLNWGALKGVGCVVMNCAVLSWECAELCVGLNGELFTVCLCAELG